MPLFFNEIIPNSQDNLFVLFNTGPLPCFIIAKDSMQIKAANEKAVDLYNYDVTEYAAKNFLDLHDLESKIHLLNCLKGNATLKQKSFKQQKKHGEIVVVELYLSEVTINDLPYLQLCVVDITNNISRQAELSLEVEKYKLFIEQSSEGIFCQELKTPMSIHLPLEEMVEILKIDGYISECNDALAKMYGHQKSSDIIGLLPEQLLDLNDPANTEYFKAFIRNDFKIVDAESHEKDKNGQSRYFLNNAVGIIENGFLKRIWGTQRDITERKKIEKKIQLLANLVEETSDLLMAADLDFKPLTWNNAAEKIHGIKAEQIIGNNIRDFIEIFYGGKSKEEVREILNETGSWKGEMSFCRPSDNEMITLLATFKQLKDENGLPIGYVVAGTDITKRKAVELKLAESEKRFRDVADSAPVMIWMSNEKNETSYVNKPWTDFTGMSTEMLSDTNWNCIVHPDDEKQAIKEFNKSFEQLEPITMVYRLKKQTGEFRWVLDTAIPRKLNDGTFLGYIGSVVDINDQKIKEDQLCYQATILDNVLDIVVTTDIKGVIKSWNKIAEEVYGFTTGQAIGKSFIELVQFDFVDSDLASSFTELEEKGLWRGEIIYKDASGNTKYFVQSVKYIFDQNGEKGILAVGKDITDRKIAEENVKKSEQFYRSLIADSLDGISLVDAQGTITFVSPSIKHILGYEPEEGVGKNLLHFVHPDDQVKALESFEKEVAESSEIKFILVRLRKKDGEWLWCTVRAHNLLNNPYVRSVAMYFHDDSLRKKASDAVKANEQLFRALIMDLQVGVLLQDDLGNVLMSNNAMNHMLCKPEETFIGKKIWELYEDVIKEDGTESKLEERPTYRAVHEKIRVRNSVIGVLNPETKMRRWMMVNADPIINNEGQVMNIVCSFVDITERKRLEEQLLTEQLNQQKALTQATIDGQEKERKEIGKELHDNVGQLLTTTKLYLELAKTSSVDSKQDMVALSIKSILEVINEVRNISRSLIPPTLGDLGLIDSIYDLIESINRTQPLIIELDDHGFKEDAIAENQKLMLFRIVQEQLNNILKHAQAQNVFIKVQNNMPMLYLEIKDDGKGFDMAITRKGLGLANIKNRAELFGGKMEIVSSNGNGCTLKVTVPDQFINSPN